MMRGSILCRALQASVLGLMVTRTFAQTIQASATVELGPIKTLACYSKPDPLTESGTNTFQTSGSCQIACGNANSSVMAITGGSTCYCGNEFPPLDKQVDGSKCNEPCQGFDQQTCGGIGFWQVYLTGLSGDVDTAPNSTTSSASPSSTVASSTQAPETVVVTASSTIRPSSSPSTSVSSDVGGDAGPSKVGIAVGVVVGVLAIAAIAGGAIFFMKQRRRKQIEEEHKAQAAVNPFVGSRSSDTKSDARLDPSVASSYRRESIGSIADERDFSRKILQVRNPDNRGSLNTLA